MQNYRSIDFLKPENINEKSRILLWDIDGTLIRSTRPGSYKTYFAAALQKTYGTSGNLTGVQAAGKTDLNIVFQALEHEGFTVEKIAAHIADFSRNLRDAMNEYLAENENVYEILPGAQEILTASGKKPHLKNALLTGNIKGGAEIKLNYVGIWDFFADTPNAFGEISHDRRELSAAAGKLFRQKYDYDFKAEQFIVIGDTPFDVDCARHFGAKVICVETGNGIERADLEQAKPDAIIKDLSDTEKVLEILQSI